MKRLYFQPEVLVANIAMTSFLCSSPSPVVPTDNQDFSIGGGDPGDAI